MGMISHRFERAVTNKTTLRKAGSGIKLKFTKNDEQKLLKLFKGEVGFNADEFCVILCTRTKYFKGQCVRLKVNETCGSITSSHLKKLR